jgi:hypothetical protein
MIQTRNVGKTISAIKEIARQLELEKTVRIIGLKTTDLYLKMLEQEGVYAEATELYKGDELVGFDFKLK